MNVKRIRIFDKEFVIQDKDLVDPTYRQIRGLYKQPFCTPLVRAFTGIILTIIAIITSLTPLYLENVCSVSPCLNNGLCVVNGSEAFNCVCQPQYNGNRCQFYNNCWDNTICVNNSTCVQYKNNFKCYCASGYYGNLCQNYNSCWNRPCEGCQESHNKSHEYECTCSKFSTLQCKSDLKQPLGVSLAVLGLIDGRLASSFDDNTIKLTNDLNFTNYTTLYGHKDRVTALAQLNSDTLCSGSWDRTIQFWDLTSLTNSLTIQANQGRINTLISADFNSDSYLISSGDTANVKIWNQTGLVNSFTAHNDSVNTLAYMYAFRYLATGSKDKSVKLFELKNYQYTTIANLNEHASSVNALAVLTSKQLILSGSSDTSVKVFNSSTFKLVANIIGHAESVNALAILPSTQSIVSASNDTTIKIWNSTSFELIADLTGHTGPVNALAILNSTQYVVSVSFDETIKIWSWSHQSFQVVATLTGHTCWINAVAVIQSNENIVSAAADNTIRIWRSMYPFDCLAKLTGHTDYIKALAILPSSENIVSAGDDKTIRIWNSATYECIVILKGHTESVMALDVSSEYILSASLDQTIKVWHSKTFQVLANLTGHTKSVNALAVLDPINFILLSGSEDTTVKEWRIVFNSQLVVKSVLNFQIPGSVSVISLAFFQNQYLVIGYADSKKIDTLDVIYLNYYAELSMRHRVSVTVLLNIESNPPLLASGTSNKKIIIWDANFNKFNQLCVQKSQINSLTLWRNKSYLVSSSMDTSILIWKATLGLTLKHNLNQDKRQIEATQELENGLLAAASDDFSIKIFNNSNGYELAASLEGHLNDVFCLVKIPERNQLASGSKDRSIIIWNEQNLNRIATLYGHLRGVISLEVINKSSSLYLASGSCDKTIIVWDLTTFREKKHLRKHTGCVNVLNLYKKAYLISGSSDGNVIIWDVAKFKFKKYLLKISQPITALASSSLSLTNSYLALGSADTHIYVYSDKYTRINVLNAGAYVSVTTIAISPKTGNIFSGLNFGKIRVWNATSFKPIVDYFFPDYINALTFMPTSDFLVSATNDNNVKVWQIVDKFHIQPITSLVGHTDNVLALTVLHSNENIISGSADTTILIWDWQSSELLANLTGHSAAVNALTILPTNQRIVSASDDTTLKVWSSSYPFELIADLTGHTSRVNALAVVPSTESVISASDDMTIMIWSSVSFECIAILRGHTSPVTALSILNLTKYIVSAAKDGTIKIWDSKTFKTVDTLREYANLVVVDQVTQNILSTSYVGGDIDVWSKTDGLTLAATLKGHSGTVFDLKFAENNNLISCSSDASIRVWDLTTLNNNTTFTSVNTKHQGGVLSLEILKNGDLVTSSMDKTVKIWDTNQFFNISTIH